MSDTVLDMQTAQAAVVLQDRPLVALTPWLAALLGECKSSGRMLQLVTPPESRISLPVRLAGGSFQWVARDTPDGYYEALTGRPLKWNGTSFAPIPEARDYAPGFRPRSPSPAGSHLTLTYRARHGTHTVRGGQVEQLFTLLTGRPPAGWGPAEPVPYTWDRATLTTFVRDGDTTRLVAVGTGGRRTAIATMGFAERGDTETTTLTVGYSPDDPPPVRHLESLANALAAENPVASLLVQVSPGRPDVTFEPRWTGRSAPVGLAVAGEHPPATEVPARLVGPAGSPLTWFALGDGRDPEGWQRHQALLRQLRLSG